MLGCAPPRRSWNDSFMALSDLSHGRRGQRRRRLASLITSKRGHMGSDPVSSVDTTPLFGGATGVRRAAPGAPTSVPGNLPASRGVANSPGRAISAPAVRSSYNRQDRGSNVTIPYPRIARAEETHTIGRVAPGDVVFHSTYRDAGNGRRNPTPMRIVGVDLLNQRMGGVPGHSIDSTIRDPHVIGYSAIVSSLPGDGHRPDDWRTLAFFKEWACDGVVLSNDEPGCFSDSAGVDGRLFNIAVQGIANVHNGYCDTEGRGVTDVKGRLRGAPDAFGAPGNPLFPLQMFNRDIHVGDTLFVGLVGQRSRISNQAEADDLNSHTERFWSDARATANQAEVGGIVSTFHLAPFSSRHMNAHLADPKPMTGSKKRQREAGSTYADPKPMTGSKKRQREADSQYAGLQVASIKGLVGAWKIGTVLDSAATVRGGGGGSEIPDARMSVTANVNVEFLDWRCLRRRFHCPYVGQTMVGDRWTDLQGHDDKRLNSWPTLNNKDNLKNWINGELLSEQLVAETELIRVVSMAQAVTSEMLGTIEAALAGLDTRSSPKEIIDVLLDLKDRYMDYNNAWGASQPHADSEEMRRAVDQMTASHFIMLDLKDRSMDYNDAWGASQPHADSEEMRRAVDQMTESRFITHKDNWGDTSWNFQWSTVEMFNRVEIVQRSFVAPSWELVELVASLAAFQGNISGTTLASVIAEIQSITDRLPKINIPPKPPTEPEPQTEAPPEPPTEPPTTDDADPLAAPATKEVKSGRRRTKYVQKEEPIPTPANPYPKTKRTSKKPSKATKMPHGSTEDYDETVEQRAAWDEEAMHRRTMGVHSSAAEASEAVMADEEVLSTHPPSSAPSSAPSSSVVSAAQSASETPAPVPAPVGSALPVRPAHSVPSSTAAAAASAHCRVLPVGETPASTQETGAALSIAGHAQDFFGSLFSTSSASDPPTQPPPPPPPPPPQPPTGGSRRSTGGPRRSSEGL